MTTPTHGEYGLIRGFTDDQLRAALERSTLPAIVRSTILAMVTPDARVTGILEVTVGQIAKRLGIGTRQTRERLKAARQAGAVEALDRAGQPLPVNHRPPGGRRSNGIGYATPHRFGPALAPLLWPDDEGGKGEADRTLKSAARVTPNSAAYDRQGCSTPPIKGEAPRTHTKKQRRKTITNGAADAVVEFVAGSGDSIPEGWTEANHAEALALARKLGHRDPPGFVHRAGTLERVAWLEEETRSAENQGGAAENRLRKGEGPPTDWSERWRRKRELKRRAEAKQNEVNVRDFTERVRTLRGLTRAHLAAFVERRANELAHSTGQNDPDRAARLTRIHKAGRLFDSNPDANQAISELTSVGGSIGAFWHVIRITNPQCDSHCFSARTGADLHDAA